MFIVKTKNRGSIKRHDIGKFQEGCLDLFNIPVIIQMLPIDVGNDSQAGIQLQKRTIAFIRLSNDDLTITDLGIAADTGQLSTNDHGGIESTISQDRGHHGCRRCFAMTPGNGNGKFHLQKFSQHLCTRNNRNIASMRLQHLRVIIFHCCGGHDHIGIPQMRSLMPAENHSTE